jgi:hypothetical protein
VRQRIEDAWQSLKHNKSRPHIKHSREAIAEYLIGYGVGLLARLDGVREHDEAREVLEAAGDVRRVEALRWHFTIACDGQRDLYPRIDEDAWTTCTQLAQTIGLPITTVAGLALMAGLISLPIADHVRRRMVVQLRAFRDRVRDQADEAILKAKRAEPATTAEQLDFVRDVLQHKRAKKGQLEPRKTTTKNGRVTWVFLFCHPATTQLYG